MLTPSSMELLSVVVFKEKLDELVPRLVHTGLFHPVDLRDIEQELGSLSGCNLSREFTELDTLEAKLTHLLRTLGVSLPAASTFPSFSYQELREVLGRIEQKAAPLLAQKEQVREEVSRQEMFLYQIKEYLMFPLQGKAVYTFLHVSLGKVASENLQVLERSLEDVPHILYPYRREGDTAVTMLMGLKQDKPVFERALHDVGWIPMEWPAQPGMLSGDVEGKIKEKIAHYRQENEEIDRQLAALAAESQEKLAQIRSFLRLRQSLLKAKKFSCLTERTALLCGWVPKEARQQVIREIERTASPSYVEVRDPRQLHIANEEVPVRFQNNALLKPFELLISSYGMPRYGSIDPTVFVAFSFLLMFGVMFGDIGHGAVLCAAAWLFRRSQKEKIRQAGALLLYCGISSSLFGVLFGSVFGIEFPSLWIKPLHDIMSIFTLSVYFGIGMITLGIVLNVINAIRDRNYLRALFDKAGLISGALYWIAIGVVSKIFVQKGEVPVHWYALIGSGLGILFLKPLAETLLRRRREGFVVTFMESMVDILEIIMGYLANTLSFIRIAAFALAHAGLFIAIFELSRAVASIGGGALSFLVVLLGNVFVIVLEGLVVTIQSLRLNYYEFFSKFFVTGNKTYSPLKG
ncbi:MAG: hypothetical protein GF333_06185 [Candidatus Omnitrophica bacterium]|nr:hypothetical protein [Candidatus Omnitrophota bacterium]